MHLHGESSSYMHPEHLRGIISHYAFRSHLANVHKCMALGVPFFNHLVSPLVDRIVTNE